MPKRLTHEEFLERFYVKNKNAENIEILGEYVNNKTKIKCKCKTDGYEWEVKPNDLLNGISCPKCAGNIKKTTEEFVNELKEINDNIEILGEYVNAHTKIKCKCKIDGYEWETTPHSLLKGQGCPKCAGNANKTTEEFKQEMKEINDNIEILGEYKGSKIKIKCKCKIDGYIWETTPNNLLKGYGCPKCSGNIKNKTTEYFINELKEINNNIEVLGEYKGSNKKIRVRCKIDGYEWETTPSVLLNNHGCPKCSGKEKSNTERFKQEMKEINNDIEILGEYVNRKTKIKCRCKIDGHEWEATPNNLLNGSGCPKCNTSKGEKRIAKYLDNRNIKYIHDKGYFKDLKNSKNNILRPDFIIKDRKIWIEFDGKQHFEVVDFSSKNQELAKEQFEQIKENDKIKNEYAKKHNWKLIRIAYWDFDKIEEILEKEL